MAEKLDEVPTANTVMITPARAAVIPVTCILVGLFLSINADAIIETTGMHAKTTPLSDAVVRLIPTVSAIKYMQGLHTATAIRGFIDLPLRFIFTTPAAARALITVRAMKKRHPSSANALVFAVTCFVNM